MFSLRTKINENFSVGKNISYKCAKMIVVGEENGS
jgi:hypothetical protein